MHGVASLLTERAVETIGPRTSVTRSFEAREASAALIMAVVTARWQGLNGRRTRRIGLLRQACRNSKDGLPEGKSPAAILSEMSEEDGNVGPAVGEAGHTWTSQREIVQFMGQICSRAEVATIRFWVTAVQIRVETRFLDGVSA